MDVSKQLGVDTFKLVPIQGKNPSEYKDCYSAIGDYSSYIGIGGLIPKQCKEKWNILTKVIPFLKEEGKMIHVFGISENYRYKKYIVEQGCVSCDGRSPYEAAIHGQVYNRKLKRIRLNISFNPEIREALARVNVLTLMNVMKEIKKLKYKPLHEF